MVAPFAVQVPAPCSHFPKRLAGAFLISFWRGNRRLFRHYLQEAPTMASAKNNGFDCRVGKLLRHPPLAAQRGSKRGGWRKSLPTLRRRTRGWRCWHRAFRLILGTTYLKKAGACEVSGSLADRVKSRLPASAAHYPIAGRERDARRIQMGAP